MTNRFIDLVKRKANTNEIDSFINMELSNQCPVVEDIDNDDKNKLVTFIYQGGSNCKIANIYTSLIGDMPHKMTRLGHTNYFYHSMTVPNNIRAGYAFLPHMMYDNDEIMDREKRLKIYSEMWPKLICDPHNSKKQMLSTGESKATINISILEMPLAPPTKWSQKNDLINSGTVTKHTIHSNILGKNRDYWVYLPKLYDKDVCYPVIFVFDGQFYHESGIPLPVILDNLINENKIPLVIAVFIDSVGFVTRRIDLNCSEKFLNFVTDELLAEINSRYLISTNSCDRIAMGASLGGVFSLYAALNHPDLLGKVLSNSGGSNSIVDKLIEDSHPAKLKVYLDNGSLENSDNIKRARRLLIENGHDVIYQEFPGSHDLLCWETSIPYALMRLLNN